jgi:hypothetical protein
VVSPQRPRTPHPADLLIGAALAVAGALFLLQAPIAAFDVALWGPDRPWTHRDWLGAWWLFQSAGDLPGALGRQLHPEGAPALQHHIPNPWDGLLLGPLFARAPWPRAWNLWQLSLHLGNVAAAVHLGRALGAGAIGAGLGGLLTAASPVMLHEIAGGRSLSGVVAPGLLGLAWQLQGRPVRAGLAIGVQGLLYIYTGLVAMGMALILRMDLRVLLLSLPLWAAWAAWMRPVLAGLHHRPPPAGFTSLPLEGLIGLPGVPARLRVHPALLGAALLLVRGRLAAAALLAGFVALGPTPGARTDTALVASPLAWLMALVPGLGRMHHPVRAALLLVPVLGAGLGAALAGPGRRRPLAVALLLGLGLAARGPVEQAAAHAGPRPLPGRGIAEHIREAPDVLAIVDLTGAGGAALGLIPVHQRPTLEGLRRARPPGLAGQLRARVDRWLGGADDPGLWAALRAAGFSHVLAVEREGEPPVPWSRLRGALGPPAAAGLWALPPAQP